MPKGGRGVGTVPVSGSHLIYPVFRLSSPDSTGNEDQWAGKNLWRLSIKRPRLRSTQFRELSCLPRLLEAELSESFTFLMLTLRFRWKKVRVGTSHKVLFEYQRLPFGVSSAPSIFQRIMENLLQGISGVCMYIDVILVTRVTEGEHLSNLAQLLERLESAGMHLKWEKCKFMLPFVSYLGHVISAEDLHTGEAKVRSIVEAPELRSVGELRSFLGMVNYYGKFLPDLATPLSPMYQLLYHVM